MQQMVCPGISSKTFLFADSNSQAGGSYEGVEAALGAFIAVEPVEAAGFANGFMRGIFKIVLEGGKTMSRKRTLCLMAGGVLFLSLVGLAETFPVAAGLSASDTASPGPAPENKSGTGAGVGVGVLLPGYFFGQASVGSLPDRGLGFRLGAMGTVGPDWHHDFILVGTLDLVGTLARTKDTHFYVFGGPCALVTPLFGVWFDGGVGASGILDARHRSAFYGEARFVPVFGYKSFNVGMLFSAGVRFNF
jgi:hypothetical protein